MENIEQKQDDACEHNGCVGNPITNMLMSGAVAAAAARKSLSELIVYGDMITQEIVDDVKTVCESGGAETLPAEVMTALESEVEYLAGQANTVIRQVNDTDERTAHLVITCERLARGQVDLHAKIDRILNHFKVA